MKKMIWGIWFLCVCFFVPHMVSSVHAEGMEEFPPLPENGRKHFAIYREASRENRLELTMFNIAGETEGEQLIWDSALYLQHEEKYMDDMKYYLDGNRWVAFEQGYTRISDNVEELLYADLNYLHLYLLPEEIKDAALIIGDDGYYFRKKELQEDNTLKYIFYYSPDLKEYQQIGEVAQPEGLLYFYQYSDPPELGRLNGEMVCVFEPYSGRPPHYWTVGFSEGPLVIYGLDGRYIKTYTPEGKSAFVQYNWKQNDFSVSFRTVIAEAAPSGAHNTFPAYYSERYTTTDFENFVCIPGSYKEAFSDTIKTYIEKKTYSVVYHGGYDKRYGNINIVSTTPYLEKYWYEQINGEKYEIKYENNHDRRTSHNIVIGGGYSTDGIYFKQTPLNKDGFIWIEGNLICERKNEYIGKTWIENEKNIFVRLNDTLLGFAQPPVTENGRTLISVRFLFEQMGGEVRWEEALQKVIVSLGEHSVEVCVNDKTAIVDGEPTEMDVPARLINEKTMVPLRFITEQLGCQVGWDDTYQMVTVISPVLHEGNTKE